MLASQRCRRSPDICPVSDGVSHRYAQTMQSPCSLSDWENHVSFPLWSSISWREASRENRMRLPGGKNSASHLKTHVDLFSELWFRCWKLKWKRLEISFSQAFLFHQRLSYRRELLLWSFQAVSRSPGPGFSLTLTKGPGPLVRSWVQTLAVMLVDPGLKH